MKQYLNLRPPYGRLLEFTRPKLQLLKNARSMLKSHTQVVQVYRQPFRRKSLLKCASQPEIAKNSLKTSL